MIFLQSNSVKGSQFFLYRASIQSKGVRNFYYSRGEVGHIARWVVDVTKGLGKISRQIYNLVANWGRVCVIFVFFSFGSVEIYR